MRAFARLVPLASLVAVLALASLGAAARAQDGAVDLRWRWRVGERLTYRVRSLTAMTLTSEPAAPTPTVVAVDETWTIDLEPLEVNAQGAARLLITYRDVRYDLRVGGVLRESHDSRKEAIPLETELEKTENAMLGVTLTASVRASGEVEGLLTPRGSLLARAKQFHIDKPDAAFSDAAIMARLSLFLHFLPDDRVSPGDAWKLRRRLDAAPGWSLVRRCAYRLGRMEGDRALLGIDTALVVEQDPTYPRTNLREPYMTGETRDSEGSAVFLSGRGVLLRLVQRWTTTLTTHVPMLQEKPGDAPEMVHRNVMHIENDVELVEPPAPPR